MNNNQNIQQPKPDPKGKAIASFVLGIVSVLSVIVSVYFTMRTLRIGKGLPITEIIPWPSLIGLIGLIFGIKGLKSTKKKFAIWGISLSIISLSLLILAILVALLGIIYATLLGAGR